MKGRNKGLAQRQGKGGSLALKRSAQRAQERRWRAQKLRRETGREHTGGPA